MRDFKAGEDAVYWNVTEDGSDERIPVFIVRKLKGRESSTAGRTEYVVERLDNHEKLTVDTAWLHLPGAEAT